MVLHQVSKRDWPKLTWIYPRIHNFEFGFGLSADDSAHGKGSTIVPYMYQNNSIVDYELIKTNPENADFGVVAYGDVCAGSYVPKIQVSYSMFLRPSDTEITMLTVDTLPIGISMLNRLDARDKKTNEDIETLIELTHDTGDEMTKVLWNTTKLFEGHGVIDYTPLDGFADIGLTGTGQPEGVAFDKEKFFDAMHYYTNKEMLKAVTGGMRTNIISDPSTPHGRAIVNVRQTINVPPMCKFQQPYQFCGKLFSVPPIGSRSQYHFSSETITAVEHLTVKGYVRFLEYNPDFTFARA